MAGANDYSNDSRIVDTRAVARPRHLLRKSTRGSRQLQVSARRPRRSSEGGTAGTETAASRSDVLASAAEAAAGMDTGGSSVFAPTERPAVVTGDEDSQPATWGGRVSGIRPSYRSVVDDRCRWNAAAPTTRARYTLVWSGLRTPKPAPRALLRDPRWRPAKVEATKYEVRPTRTVRMQECARSRKACRQSG